MKALGRHLLVEYYDCDKNILNNASRIEEAMTEAADQSGATIVNSIFHLFNPHWKRDLEKRDRIGARPRGFRPSRRSFYYTRL